MVIYVVILVAFQVFLLTVAVEAFAADDESLAWATATVSAAELPHYRRAGFRAERERGRYTVVARKVGA